ncbi:Mannosyltransferase 1 CMT1 [Lasiodiplodia theobromae]|nr:Mannosyltransferase 1 CMT1 [Lasiodiplodia theobromae]
MAKIFLTGASGYIGGEVLHAIATAHPEYTIRALNRDATKSALITAAYPSVTIVPGSLDDSATLEAEAAQADIVLNLAAREHLPSAQAILKGLTSPSRTSSTTAKRPYWIQVSGATLLASPEIARGTYGEPSDKIHDDLSGVAEIIALVRSNPKRATDNFVLDSGHAHGVNTALVPPGIIYGEGAGPVNRRTFQVPELARVAVERGRAVQVGRGLARWGYVHIRDLGQLFLRLVEKAAAGEDGRAGLWGEEGIYFTGVGGDISFAEISQRVAQAAFEKGYIKSADVEQLSAEEADKLIGHASAVLGTNARCEARRARELLGWKPVQHDLIDEIPVTVEAEARKLGVAS